MTTRLRRLGIVLAVLGLVFAVGSAYAFIKVQEGYRSLNAFSAAQNVTLTYNEDGQLVDRGEVADAQAIMAMLTNEWGYPVATSELNPNDPVVNTGSEYMYQMATVAYHTLHGTQTVVLDEDFTAPDGTVYTAGTPYEVPVAGRYWSQFDRTNPIDAAVREQAWTGTAHALIGELGVGTVTASTLQLGLGMAGLFAGIGLDLRHRGPRPGLGCAARKGQGPGAAAGRDPSLTGLEPRLQSPWERRACRRRQALRIRCVLASACYSMPRGREAGESPAQSRYGDQRPIRARKSGRRSRGRCSTFVRKGKQRCDQPADPRLPVGLPRGGFCALGSRYPLTFRSRIVPTFASPAARLARHAFLLVVALVVVACSSGAATSPVATPSASPSVAAPSEPPASSPSASPAAVTYPLTLTDDEGTSITLPAEPQKIVSLTPAETEILFALGAGDRVVGKVEDIANYPPEAADVPVMGRFDGVDVEQIVDAGADLVLAGGSGGTPPDAIERLRAVGVPVLVVYAKDVDGALADVQLTADAVGRSAEGEAMVDEMRAAFDEVAEATADLERPRVFIETGNQPAIYGIADDSVYAEMIELAGGEAVTTGSATNWEMPVERLVAEDPEIILLADAAYGATADEVRGRPGWDVVTAVRDDAIQPIDDIVTTRPGPRLTEGLQALLAAIHPDVKVGSRRY